MSLLWELITNHRHYWGVPHKVAENASQVIMVCYGCGKVHDVKADILSGR